MTALVWWLLSFVPGTAPHRDYRDTAAWYQQAVDHVERYAALSGVGPHGWPPRLPRSPAAMRTALEVLLPLVEATGALAEGKPELAQEFLVRESEPL